MVAIFVDIIVLIVLIVFVAVGLTQIVVPILDNRPLFPMFRKSVREIQTDIVEVSEDIYESGLRRQAAKLAAIREMEKRDKEQTERNY
jgi:hypothetical protein